MFSSSLFLVAYTVAVVVDGGSYMVFFSGGLASAARFGTRPCFPAFGPVTAAMSQFRLTGDPTNIPPIISGTVIRHELRRERTANSHSKKWL
jgi:hypothetical protein